MKHNAILAAALLLLRLALPAYAEDVAQDAGQDARGEVVATSFHDIDHDGEFETVEIYVESGRRYVDEEEWCGKGEKWEGVFRVRVADNRKLLRDNTDPLPVESFRVPAFEVRFADYNSDGNIDFNVTRHASCACREVRLFTVYPDGRVVPLDVDGDGLFATTDENSTDVVKAVGDGCLTTSYRDVTRGDVTETWCWKGSMFFLESTTVAGGE